MIEKAVAEEAREDDDFETMLEQVVARCTIAKIETQRDTGWIDDEAILKVSMPNGRETRQILVTEGNVARFLASNFEDFRFLGDYQAVVDVANNTIEASISTRSGVVGVARMMGDLPGVVVQGAQAPPVETDDAEELSGESTPTDWQLVVHREGVTIEISPRSNNFFGVTSRQRHTTTLKISGAPCTTQEEALTTLEALGGAMLFEIDLRYGRPFDLTYQPRSPVMRRVRRSKELPSFPKNQYAVEPLALYNYGRAAFRFPLLEFLAYYQVLEYFFSIFTGQELIKQLRFSLKDPRFNLNDDVAVGRVLASISLNSRGATNERDQLRATVRACIDVAAIEDFVTSNSRIKDHFCSKSQVVKNVPRLIFAPGQPDYREQVADRLYAIRCRVVHTKQEGGDSGVDLLLPSSREAQALGADVELAKLLAQQALIVAATPVN